MAQVQAGNDNTTFLTLNATTVIKGKSGFLGKLVITNVGTTATVVIYDNATVGSGNVLASWATADGKGPFEFKARAVNGITVVVSNSSQAGYITWS